MVMLKDDVTVKIAQFKAHLAKYLRDVRNGHSITILDRNTPIAKVISYQVSPGRLAIRKATRSVKDVKLPPPLRKKIDVLTVLKEERRERL